MATTKDNFIKAMNKSVGWEICATSSSGKILRLEVPIKDREGLAKIIAKAHGGKISSKKTVIDFGAFKVELKNPIPKAATKTGAVEFGLLREYHTKKLVTSPYTLHMPTSAEPDEMTYINDVNTFIKKINHPIDIKLNNKIYKNICGANKVHGTPKADLVLVQFDEARKSFKEVAFISHKKGGGAKAFQQYGGISTSAGRVISDNKLVLAFLADLAMFIKATTGKYEAKSGISVFRTVPNTAVGRKLVAQSLFGPDWGGRYGADSVHCIAQGNPKLTKNGNVFLLSGEAIHPPKADWALKGPTDNFRAVFAATFRNGRKFAATVDGKRVNVGNMRVGIYPYAFVSGRKAEKI